MDNNMKKCLVASLMVVVPFLLIYANLGTVWAQEENYHVVECVLPNYFLCQNGNCLPESHMCDGENDCGDSSDENPSVCKQIHCNETSEFQCASGRCLPKENRCDRVAQCRDRSDELECVYEPCPKGKFSCANHSQCLDMSEVCDGSIDCKDGLASDELHPDPCPANVTCPHYAFKCNSTNVCALPNWMCDGENDCGDNSDEDGENCKNFQCPEDWFRCADNRCIPLSNVCNGVIDCKDGLASDERHPDPCPKNVTCPNEFFSCEETNICAHPHWLCDGADDCGDKSDENIERCTNTPCPEEWFRCKSQRCIPPNWRCDGSNDCPTGEDENECESYLRNIFVADNNTMVSFYNYTDGEVGVFGKAPIETGDNENVESIEDGDGENQGQDNSDSYNNNNQNNTINTENENKDGPVNSNINLQQATANSSSKQKPNPISSYVLSQSSLSKSKNP